MVKWTTTPGVFGHGPRRLLSRDTGTSARSDGMAQLSADDAEPVPNPQLHPFDIGRRQITSVS